MRRVSYLRRLYYNQSWETEFVGSQSFANGEIVKQSVSANWLALWEFENYFDS